MREHILKIFLRCLPLLVLPLLASCRDDEEDVAITDRCYIKSVTLGTVKRTTSKHDQQGAVIQTVNSSYSAGTYTMSIDQRDSSIENHDSLPYGSRLSAVIVNIAFEGAYLLYREKGTDNNWMTYNSTDSLDLRKPLELLVPANNGDGSRSYTLKVNVHQQEGDSLYWHQTADNVPAFTDLADMKAFTLGDKLMVLGRNASGISLAERSTTEAQGTWEELTTNLPASADLQSLCQQDGKLYLSTADGDILTSTDKAATWTAIDALHTPGIKLIGASSKFLYAMTGTTLLRATESADTWETEKLDTDGSHLPAVNILTQNLKQPNGNERIVMTGNDDTGSSVKVWSKMWNHGEPENSAEWMYIPHTPDNKALCPVLDEPCLIAYDGQCVMFGGKSADGKHQALSTMFVSPDYGITWHPGTNMHPPFPLNGSTGNITATVDKNNFIWIITNTQVWRGRLNRLGFARQ